jgi:hypothetical protein
MRRPLQARSVAITLLAVAGAFVLACSEHPAAPDGTALRVSGARSASTDMTVASVSPDSATQDTTLDVVINGSGFVSGTVATWALQGVADPSQVRTNSTRYITSKKLIANITISTSATVGKWDVIVAASSKGGIGTEMFTIKLHGNVDTSPKANLVWEENVNVAPPGQSAVWQPALLTGDYRARDGSPLTNGKSGEYQGMFCGSDSYMETQDKGVTQTAMNFDPDHSYDPATMDGACGGKRYYQFYLSGRGAAPLLAGPQHYALHLGDLAVGQSLLEEVHFGVQQTNCGTLRFDDGYPPASNARVTRLTDSSTTSGPLKRWLVESQGTHRAMCTIFANGGKVQSTGVSYYLPFAFTVTEIVYPFPHYP